MKKSTLENILKGIARLRKSETELWLFDCSMLGIKPVKQVRTDSVHGQKSQTRIERFEADVAPYIKKFEDVLLKKSFDNIQRVVPQYHRYSEEELTKFLDRRNSQLASWLGNNEFESCNRPYDVSVSVWDNAPLNEGWDDLWNLIIGAGGTVFSNANTEVGAGDGTTPASTGDTDLVGATKSYFTMTAGFPTVGSTRDCTFKGQAVSGVGNHPWDEFTIRNNDGTPQNFMRKVSAEGTKDGQTWNLAITPQITT